MYTSSIATVFLVAAASVSAIPFPSVAVRQEHFEVLALRASTNVNPNAITGTTCIDTTAYAHSSLHSLPPSPN